MPKQTEAELVSVLKMHSLQKSPKNESTLLKDLHSVRTEVKKAVSLFLCLSFELFPQRQHRSVFYFGSTVYTLRFRSQSKYKT